MPEPIIVRAAYVPIYAVSLWHLIGRRKDRKCTGGERERAPLASDELVALGGGIENQRWCAFTELLFLHANGQIGTGCKLGRLSSPLLFVFRVLLAAERKECRNESIYHLVETSLQQQPNQRSGTIAGQERLEATKETEGRTSRSRSVDDTVRMLVAVDASIIAV